MKGAFGVANKAPQYGDAEDEQESFFLFGPDRAGRRRLDYEQLKRRKLMLCIGGFVGLIALIGCIAGLVVALHASSSPSRMLLPKTPNQRKGKDSTNSKAPMSMSANCLPGYDVKNTDLVFFVIGDWGRADSNQQKVAAQMAQVAGCMSPKFVVSTGDNFYPSGLRSASDPQFDTSFKNMYSDPKLQVPWYVVLGNHDYGDGTDKNKLVADQCLTAPTSVEDCANKCCYGPYWQVKGGLESRDWRWNATFGVVTRTFPLSQGRSLDIIFIDTNPTIYRYSTAPFVKFLDGWNSQDGDVVKQATWDALNQSVSSGSTWRLVVGHHPVHSYGTHCTQLNAYDCTTMQAWLAPWLRRFRVAAYINGHDHDQQLIKEPPKVDGSPADDPVVYAVSGAGSDTRTGEFNNVPKTQTDVDALWLSDEPGFMAVVLSKQNTMRLIFYKAGVAAPAYTFNVPLPNW